MFGRSTGALRLIASIVVLGLVACSAPATTAVKPTEAPKPAAPIAAPPLASSAAAAVPSPATSPAASPVAKPAGSVPTGPIETVRVAQVPSVLFAPFYVAIEKGYFRELGIDVKIEQVTAGQDATALAATDQLDVVIAGFAAATFNAIDRGLDLRIVSSMGQQSRTGYASGLMVRKDLIASGQVKDIKDLKGKKFALAGGLGSTSSYWLASKLRDSGLSLKDVEVVNLGFPDQVAALKQGAIDVASPASPFTNQVLRDGSGEFFGGQFSPGASAVGSLFGGGFIKNKPDVARRFMLALVRGSRDVQGANAKSDANVAIYSKYTNLPAETIKTMDMYEFDPNLSIDVRTLMDMQQVFIAEGLLRIASPLPAERWADETFSKWAVDQLK